MRVNSREYQIRLRADRFEQGDAAALDFIEFLSQFRGEPKVLVSRIERVAFERKLLDTPQAHFARAGLKLRTRAYPDRISCSFKAIGPDRYVVERAPVDCADASAKAKFEEGIYAYHSSYSKQATTRQPIGTTFDTVGAWAKLFPRAVEVAPASAPLVQRGRSAIVLRVSGFSLDFGEYRAPASIEIAYSDRSLLGVDKVEFSWKYRDKREDYAPAAIDVMRRFFQAVNHSEWVDLSVHLDKAQTDASSYYNRVREPSVRESMRVVSLASWTSRVAERSEPERAAQLVK